MVGVHLPERESSSRPSTYRSRENQINKCTDRNTIISGAASALQQHGVIQTYSSSSAPRTVDEGYRTHASAVDHYVLFDGTPAKLILPKKGFAQKVSGASVRVTSQQLKHAVWAQGIGDKTVNANGSKMFPTEMERSMRLRGTEEGELAIPNDEYMRANEFNQPTFKFSEQLSAQQLKGYVSQTRPKLFKQLSNLEAKEAKAAAVDQDELNNPDRFRLDKMNTGELRAELVQHSLDSRGRKVDLHARLLVHLLAQRIQPP